MAPLDIAKLKIEADLRKRQCKSLEREFREASREYEQGNVTARRKGVLIALGAVLNHIHEELHVDRAVTRPLRDLWDAAWDADRGARNDLLQPKKLDHRPPLSSRDLELMRAVAIAIDLRMMTGHNKKDAARYVAKEVIKLGVDLGGKPDRPDWKIVAGWRDRLSAARLTGRSKHWHSEGVLYHYESTGLHDAVKEGRMEPKELLARQLEKIRSLVCLRGEI